MASSAFGPRAWAPLERALTAYWEGDRGAVLTVLADEGEPDPMPVSVFFRGRENLRDVDRAALAQVRGRVLDGGAGVGALTLILQEEGHAVTAVEAMPEAVLIMEERGVQDARAGRLEELGGAELFDTILLMMNGTALAGTLNGLPSLLATLAGLLAPGGQVLLDSTDPFAALGESEPSGSAAGPDAGAGPEAVAGPDAGAGPEAVAGPDAGAGASDGPSPPGGWEEGCYPGEFQYQMEYRGEKGAPFPQLFIDPETLEEAARQGGWHLEVVRKWPGGEFLARLTRAQGNGGVPRGG